MSWYTLADAAAMGISREGWERRIAAGQVQSYVDGYGRRMVWVEDSPVLEALAGFRSELSSLRDEVRALTEEMRGAFRSLSARPDEAAPERPRLRSPAPPRPAAERPRLGRPASSGPAAPRGLLERVDTAWAGSDRELERRAGLPQRFLTKARRGERNGPRAAPSWEKLRSFLDDLDQATRAAA